MCVCVCVVLREGEQQKRVGSGCPTAGNYAPALKVHIGLCINLLDLMSNIHYMLLKVERVRARDNCIWPALSILLHVCLEVV